MQKSILFIIAFFLPIAIYSQFSEEINYERLPLQEALSDLESKYDVVFSYTADLTDNFLVTLNAQNESIDNILTEILSPINLEYNFYDNNYVVITKQKAVSRRLCALFVNEEGESLPYVNVYLPRLQIGTSGDEVGNLDWTQKIVGNEKVEVSYTGYESHLTSVSDLESCPQIILRAKQFSFQEVIVKEYVTSGIEQSEKLDHMVMRPEKINMLPGLTDADVLQMVQLLPGVESIDESATGLHVRGGTPDQNLILYDGIPIYNGGHFFGMISAFNPELVDKVEVYRSGFGPNFGGRVASVIDIKSVNSIPERIKVDAGVNFTHGDFSLTVPMLKNKIGLVLGARKSYTKIIETPTYKKLSERVFRKGKLDEVKDEDPEVIDFGLGFDFNDYNAKLLIDASKKDKFSISYFQIDDNLNFDFDDFDDDFKTNDKIDQSSNGVGMRWERDFNSSLKSSINASWTSMSNNYVFKIVDIEGQDEDIEDSQFNKIIDKTLVWDNAWTLNDTFSLDFGMQYADLFVERSWQFDDAEEDANAELDDNKIFTGYLSLNSKFKNKFKTKIGLRWNFANATSENILEPRMAIQYIPTNSFQLKASAGVYRQFLSQVIEFNDLGINQDFWVLADDDENIPIAKSENFSLGMIYHPKSFMLEIEGYYKRLSGLTSNLSSFRIEMDEEFELGTGTSWGIDVLMKKRWRDFKTWVSYSFSRTQYQVDLEDEKLQFRAPHDRPHSFSFVNQYQKNRWNVSLSWKIASGIVYTRALGLNDQDEDAEPEFDLADINTDRLPISHRLDLSVMYRLFHKNGLSGKLGFSLLNIYNRENIMSREYFSVYDEEEDRTKLQARDREMLRFTPNLVLRIGFQ